MLWGGIVFILVIAAVLSAILVGALGWRHPRTPSAWSGAFFAFLLVAMMMWAASIWVQPMGPQVGGLAWAPVVGFGVLIALLLVALAEPKSALRDAEHRAPRDTSQPVSEPSTFGAVFWILLVAALASAIVGEIAV